MEATQEKVELRKVILKLRRSQNEDERSAKSALIMKHLKLMPIFQKAKKVACYYSQDGEVDTQCLIDQLLNAGKTVFLPRIECEKAVMVPFSNRSELIQGAYGIMEPMGNIIELAHEHIDVWIVPGVAFDKKGFRLGYGAGYYDHLLMDVDRIRTVGLSFEFQLVHRVPTGRWDKQLGWIITEKKVYCCHK